MTVTEFRCAIELRVDESRLTPGRIVGTLMQYETRAGDRPEMFAAGALAWPEGGIVLNEQHNRQAAIMRFKPEARDGAVVIDAALPDTQRGRDAATGIRNGTFRGLSVEFRAQEESQRAGVRTIRKAALIAAGLVDSPSYPASGVEVRKRAGGRRTPKWL